MQTISTERKRILVNAASAKIGGARTIIESFYCAARHQEEMDFVILAGFAPPSGLPSHIEWIEMPISGARAAFFHLFSVLIYYHRFRCSRILSFNNMNCIFLGRDKCITYFHQAKVLDRALSEVKLRVTRAYLEFSRDRVVVQSPQVRDDFVAMFGDRHPISIAWPGISVPEDVHKENRSPSILLIPVTTPESSHKNFGFIRQTAELLGPAWEVQVTAQASTADAGGADNISFIGPQSREELFRLYRQAACVMLASTHETVGLPIFEALAVDTPVVAFDAPYIRALREKFGISSGLEIAATPEEAHARILGFSRGSAKIEYLVDFRESEWGSVFETV